MNSADPTKTAAPEKLYAQYITNGRKTSILICEPESQTRSSEDIECGDNHVHINVIRNTNRFQVIECGKEEENRSMSSKRDDGPVCITVSIRVNDGTCSKTDRNSCQKQGDYGPRAEVPSPKEDHPKRIAMEHNEASSECSYNAGGRVPDNPRAPSPSDHIYEICSEHEMKLTLQGDRSKLSTAEILSIKKVTEFLLNKGNQFEMNICDWQYAEESKLDWYHGRIDKEEARRRLDASVPGSFLVRDAAIQRPLTEGGVHEYTLELNTDKNEFKKLKIVKLDDKYNFEKSTKQGYPRLSQLIETIIDNGLDFKEDNEPNWRIIKVIPISKPFNDNPTTTC